MFFHAVLMQLESPDEAFLAQVEHYAARIRAELDEVRAYHFGRNRAARGAGWDWVVLAQFDDEAAHERYQTSELHGQMKAYMTPRIRAIMACDLDTSSRGAGHG